MSHFYDKDVLLHSETAKILYNEVKNLPIIDYHCHLSAQDIVEDRKFENITQLWLYEDHYKWRAMRLCGVDEKYITGDAPDYKKFEMYCSIMPQLCGNPLYYWSHMELKKVFDCDLPINKNNAEAIYNLTEEKLKNLSARRLLKLFDVRYVATTNDLLDSLDFHGYIDGVIVAPTFRPDKLFDLDEQYINSLSVITGIYIKDITDLEKAIEKRLQFFISKGCKIADHGMDFYPSQYVSKDEANRVFISRNQITNESKNKFFCYMMDFFAALYNKYGIIMQLHEGTYRNVNSGMFRKIGKDSGFDIFRGSVDTDNLVEYLNRLNIGNNQPNILLYALNPNAIPSLCTVSGAFRNVRVSAAWWFNDSVNGIKKHFCSLSEYSVLGTNTGMLTDSRSFTGYVRFDFFRRLLADYIGKIVDDGEYDMNSASDLMKNICYFNIKGMLCI